ncbi:CaiB/BaiF CoA transferase family protein [Zavarzinia sp.]|uniref:CaiB/BaiF CoA transferase family protein n=1 Tax=Zavarzinia sp. TaxID=2027920 RepID=UPI003BB5AEF7
MTETKGGPLSGIRILDFTRVLSGPYCTALLADLGADVVKVEAPQGDDYRHVAPFRDGESALFQLVNRNKRGIAIDLKQKAGQALAQALALRADVVIENFRPGVADRLGLGAEGLLAANSRLVYASISGFGQTGPNAGLPAFDLVAQGLSGLMALTGEPQGEPMKVGESIGDLAAGLFASWSILAALLEREKTGRGRRLDIAMLDSLVALLPTAVAQWMFGGAPTRVGNRHPLSTPFGAYRARDGHVVICVLNAVQFGNLVAALGQPRLSDDPRFASDSLRTEHETALRPLIEAGLARWTVAEAVAALSAAGVPAAPILEAAEVFAGDHVRGRGLIGETAHPTLGTLPAMEQPVHFAGLARGGQRPAPALGADNADVLSRWLGHETEQIAALSAAGTIVGKRP